MMRFMPDKDELLALTAVWIICPVVHFAAWVCAHRFGEFGGSLPLFARFAFAVSRSNQYCIPSLIGTGCIVLVGRFASTLATKRFLCHLITLAAFCFTTATMLCFLMTVAWVIK